MEDKKSVKVSLGTVTCIVIIILMCIGLVFLYLKNNDLKSQIAQFEQDSVSKNATINDLQTKIGKISETINANEEKSNNSNKTSESANSYNIDKIKNVNDVISDNDTKLVKAQKIAKEVMNAVNNQDWYYLAKMVGTDADYFIKYGIHNYNINVNDYQEINDEYVFNETYETTSTVTEALGKMLIIKFENGGRIVIDPNCTGI